MTDIRLNLASLESIIICFIRPIFFSANIIESPKSIHVVIAHHKFVHISIADRIKYVYNLLEKHGYNYLEEYPVIVEVFDENQLDDLFEITFNESK